MVLIGGALVTSQVLVARYAGAVNQQDLFGDGASAATKEKASDIKGPLNILLVGVDTRESVRTWQPHSDTVMIRRAARASLGIKNWYQAAKLREKHWA